MSHATRTLPAMEAKLDLIDELASRQWSLVTRQQLVDGGMKAGRIRVLLRNRALRPVRVGVYATAGSRRDWQHELMAAVLYAGDGSVASHSSAARLWKFVHRPEDAIEVTFRSDLGLKRRGVHRTTILPEDDRETRSGIPCTSFERTMCDCTTLLSPFQLGRVLDHGLRNGTASLARLERCAARLDSGPGRRLGVVKALVAQRDAGFDPGGSASELHVLEVIHAAGLPAPVQQYSVRVDERSYRLDFAWPAHRVLVEYYGLAVHSGASAVASDNERLTALVRVGWRPLVFTDATPDREIVRSVADALSREPSVDPLQGSIST